VGSIKWILLKWSESYFGGDMATHVTVFGVMVGFITKPAPPSISSHVDGIYPEAEVVHPCFCHYCTLR
jgi:hypothetical protein